MKYIKLYESFETDIKDILLEVTDLGYQTIYNYGYSKYIAIFKRSTHINYNEVKDCILRIKDYLGDRYFSCEICDQYNRYPYKIKLDDDFNVGDREITRIYINFDYGE